MAESKTHDQLIEDLRAEVANVEQGHARFFAQGIKKGSVELRQSLMKLTHIAKELRKVTMATRKEMPNDKRVSPPRASIDQARPELVPTAPVKRKRRAKATPAFDSTDLKPISVK